MKRKTMAALVVALTAVLLGVLAVPALAGNPTAGLPTTSVAKALAGIKQAKAPGCTTATASHGAWQHLGGNPALPGGAWTRGKLQSFFNSPRGRSYLDLAFNGDQTKIAAVIRQVQEDNFTQGKLHYCDIFPRESFGRNGPTLAKNVTFLDKDYRHNGAPAWKIKVVLRSKLVNTKVSGSGSSRVTTKRYALYVVVVTVPNKCANISPNYYTVYVSVKTKGKATNKPKTTTIPILKIAEDDQGHQLPATPTGTFQFQVASSGMSSKVTYNHSPQTAGTCTIGKSVTVTELTPLGTDKWKMLTPATQTQVCKVGMKFVFKDQEVAPVVVVPTVVPTVVCTGNQQPVYDNSGIVVSCSSVTIIVTCSNVGNNNGGNCNGTPPPPPPSTPVHHCAPSVGTLQKDERTATFTVSCDGPMSSETWTFSGNGRTATGTSVDNTFPDNQAGQTATGTVTVLFSDGAAAVTVTASISIPAAPPLNGGNPGPPAQATG